MPSSHDFASLGCARRAAAGLVLALACAVPAPAEVAVRWLGVAGFSIEAGGTTLLHDPYFSRPGILATLFSWYRPDEAVLAPLVAGDARAPELARPAAILIGHSHYDHLGDAPWIAGRTGAVLVGSRTSVNVALGYGLEASRTRRADPGDELRFGPFAVRVIESRHARVILGRVPFEGEHASPVEAPIHAFSFVLGDARYYLVTHEPDGVRILITSSADRHAPALAELREQGIRVDLLLAATQGRDPDYARDLVAALRPRWVVPHHYDSFLEPLDAEGAGAPSDPDDLAAFEREVRAAGEAEGVALDVRRLDLFERLAVPAQAAATGG
jgi:L-ascorbate metabolism protein UlaG (beta-lactamase superfamily)